MGVDNVARKGFNSCKVWHIRCGEMSGPNNDVIKLFGRRLTGLQVFYGNRELLRGVIKFNPAHDRCEANIFFDIRFLGTAIDVVPQHCSRRVRRDGSSLVMVQSILYKMYCFFLCLGVMLSLRTCVYMVSIM